MAIHANEFERFTQFLTMMITTPQMPTQNMKEKRKKKGTARAGA